MPQGKSIRIYLADGTVTGIRHAEVVNWTGQALMCPRTRIGELSQWDEAKRPGAYVLFGIDPESGEPLAYIGEAENVFDRLQQHVGTKEFWNEAVFFTNKDQNLTKAHVKYLESRFLEIAAAGKRYKLENGNIPQRPALPRSDRDSMEEYVDLARGLLGVLGHRLLEPPAAQVAPTTVPAQPGGNMVSAPSVSLAGTELLLSVGGLNAKAVLTDEGLVVRAGSHAAKDVKDSLSQGYRKLRDSLVTQGILADNGETLVLTADQLFTSSSQAAAVIVGYSINGRNNWKDIKGKTLAALEGA